MDTGPLITLAAADSLDYLLYPAVPLYVPDAVLYEATRDSAALGDMRLLQKRRVRIQCLVHNPVFGEFRRP